LKRNANEMTRLLGFALWLAAASLTVVGGATPSHAKPVIVATTNQAFGTNGQRIDLYTPKVNARTTAVLFIHGGGFTTGSKADMTGHAKLFAQSGFVTASMDYRLSPRFPAPAAMIDVNEAVDWLRARPGVSRVVVMGYSAGGTLALMSGLQRPKSVAAIICAAGPTDLAALMATTPFPRLKAELSAYVGRSSPSTVSPIAQSFAAAPPIFLIHGDKDKLVPIAQSVAMAQKLRASNANLLLKVIPGVGHEVLLPNPHFAEILRDISKYLIAVDGS
jgi:acetyl esterase/lipase